MKKTFYAGYNIPGYLPDHLPYEMQSFESAKLFIYEELMRYLHELYNVKEVDDPGFAQHEIEISALQKLDNPFSYKLGPYVFWVQG